MIAPFATRFLRDRSGNTAVEFALVLPSFLLLTIGSLSACALFFAITNLQFAVEDGARCAAVKTTICTNATSIAAYAKSKYIGPEISPVFSYTTAAPCAHRLKATGTFGMNLIPQLTNIPISATACYP